MTLDKILSYFSSFGTFISAIAALYAIWLTIFQRRLSYKPVLIIGDILIKSTSEDINTFRVNCLTGRDNIKARINNIGLGTAISLKYRWEYDYKKGIEEYQSSYIDRNGKEDDGFSISETYGLVNLKSEISNMTLSAVKHNQEVNFVLPYNTQKKGTELLVPSPALIIMSNILFIHFSKLNSDDKKIAGPKLIVEYQDLEGKTTVNEWQSEMGLIYITFGNPKAEAQWMIKFTPVSKNWTHKGLQKIRKSYVDFMNENYSNKNN